MWIDVESTGLNPKINSIIDFGAIIEIDNKIDPDNIGDPHDEFFYKLFRGRI